MYYNLEHNKNLKHNNSTWWFIMILVEDLCDFMSVVCLLRPCKNIHCTACNNIQCTACNNIHCTACKNIHMKYGNAFVG